MSFSCLARKLWVSGTTNQKIFQAAVVVGFFSTFALLGSVARELVVAKWFGRADVLDAFLIAFLVPSFLMTLVAGSFSSAFIPTFIQVREKQGREAAQRLLSSVMVWSLLLLVGISFLMGLLAPFYLPFLGSGFDSAKLLLTQRLLYLLLPFVVLNGLVVIWSAVLNSEERFAFPAFIPILQHLTPILFLVVLGQTWGIFVLAMGTVAGVALEVGLLVWALKNAGLSLLLRWSGVDSALRQVLGQYAPMAAAALLMNSTDLINQGMAAMLEPGSVAALNYGRKVVSLVVGIVSLPISTAVLPYFSQLVAKRDWSGCRHTLKTYSLLATLGLIPITLGLYFFSQPLVRILFERGNFTAADTSIVGRVQAMYVLQLPFYVAGMIGVRLISVLRKNQFFVYVNILNVALNVSLNLLLMRWLGVAGIALSTTIVYVVSASVVFGYVFYLLPAEEQAGPNRTPSC